jgi:hypothetical protein
LFTWKEYIQEKLVNRQSFIYSAKLYQAPCISQPLFRHLNPQSWVRKWLLIKELGWQIYADNLNAIRQIKESEYKAAQKWGDVCPTASERWRVRRNEVGKGSPGMGKQKLCNFHIEEKQLWLYQKELSQCAWIIYSPVGFENQQLRLMPSFWKHKKTPNDHSMLLYFKHVLFCLLKIKSSTQRFFLFLRSSC